MSRKKQNKIRLEKRRQQVVELYLKGATQSQIARQLGVAQSTVSADIQAIRREWRNSMIRDFDEAVAIELNKIENLEQEAWSAWESSKQPAESTKVTQSESGKKAEKIVKQQRGNPRFLEQVQRCIASRRTLLGLDAPTRIAPTSPDGKESYHTFIMSELMRLSEETQEGPTVIDTAFVEAEIKRLSQVENTDSTTSGDDRETQQKGGFTDGKRR